MGLSLEIWNVVYTWDTCVMIHNDNDTLMNQHQKIKAATVGSCQPLATRFCSAKEKRPIQAPQAVLNTLIQTLAKIDAGTQHLGPVMPHKRLGQFNRATVTNNQKFSCNFRAIPSITGTKRKPKI